MQLWLCCWRKGTTNNLEDDVVFPTIDRTIVERWFEGVKDPEFRTYSLELEVGDGSWGVFCDGPIYRGWPGV